MIGDRIGHPNAGLNRPCHPLAGKRLDVTGGVADRQQAAETDLAGAVQRRCRHQRLGVPRRELSEPGSAEDRVHPVEQDRFAD
jgi:hypothetical protein